MLAILKREFKSLFCNVTGWLFVGATLALFGLYFFVYNLYMGYPYISYALSAISFIFMITVPILTMKVLAEERKNKTDQLILTAPVSVGRIIMGKFLALAATYTICIVVICVAPLILTIFGDVPLLQCYVAILGFWLYGLTCIAIGTFVSSLTESQVVAAVLTFAVIFLGFMMTSLTGVISSSGNLLTKILNCYDLIGPFQKFLDGTFSVTGIIYYVSLIALSLFLTCQAIQKRRWTISSKKISTSVFSGGTILIAVALVVVCNLVVNELPTKVTAVDVTAQKLYSITSDTTDYLKSLEEDINIYVLSAKEDADETLAGTLQRYEDASKHVKVTYIDPSVNPNFAAQYSDASLTTNSLIVVSDARSKVIDYSNIYEYTYDSSTGSQTTSGYDGEGQITSALQYVTSENMPVVYELTGHSEISMSGDFLEVLTKSNLEVTSLNLLENDSVPADCDALLINGPESDFSDDDVTKVLEYMNNGGKVFISLDYRYMSELTNFKKILSAYEITAIDGIVADNDSAYYYQQPFYLLPYVESTDVTTTVSGATSVFMPYGVGLSYNDEGAYTITDILSSSDSAVSKVNYNTATSYTAEDGDINGPFSLGAMLTTDSDGSLFVFGSTFMFADDANAMVSGRNADLFKEVINYMVGDINVSTVVIPSKDYTVAQLTVSQNAILMYGIIWGILIPLASIVVGIIIWAKRRKK